MDILKYKFSKGTLFVVIPDALSDILKKGEMTARYYNPGEVFREVHIIASNDDKPDLQKLQNAVGEAKLYFHNIPLDNKIFLKSLGWHPAFLKFWAQPALDLARQYKPELVRSYGNRINAYLAARIKAELGTPTVISVHNTKSWDILYGEMKPKNLKQRLLNWLATRNEKYTFKYFDYFVAVYAPIRDYFLEYKVKPDRVKVIYNVVNNTIIKKDNFTFDGKLKLISIGNQIQI